MLPLHTIVVDPVHTKCTGKSSGFFKMKITFKKKEESLPVQGTETVQEIKDRASSA